MTDGAIYLAALELVSIIRECILIKKWSLTWSVISDLTEVRDCFLNSTSRCDMKSLENLDLYLRWLPDELCQNSLLSVLLLRSTKLKAFDEFRGVKHTFIAFLKCSKCDLQLKNRWFLETIKYGIDEPMVLGCIPDTCLPIYLLVVYSDIHQLGKLSLGTIPIDLK